MSDSCEPKDCSMPGFPVLHHFPPGVCSHSCPLSWWCYLAISSSATLFSFCLSQHQGLFQWVHFLHHVAKVSELQLQHQSFQWMLSVVFLRIDWFDLSAVQGILRSVLQHHNSKASILQHSAFFMVQLLQPYMTTGKTIALTIWTFVSKVMSLLFNTLSRFVIALLARSKRLLILWLQSASTVILELKKIKSVTASPFSPSICHEVMGLDAMILVFWMLSFKLAFHSSLSPSSRGSLVSLLFLPLEWYHLHIWGCQYLSQQSWFQLVSHPAWHFSWRTLHMS